MNIDQDYNYVYIKTPYDDRILKLNNDLNGTYIPYGYDGLEMQERQETQDDNAFSVNEGVAIKRAHTKSRMAYSNTQWDLVDASEVIDFDLKLIPDNELPDEMKGMNLEEKQKYIADKKQDRIIIQIEIDELSKKRDKYVAEKRGQELKNMLDKVLIQTVKEQAIVKNFEFVDE